MANTLPPVPYKAKVLDQLGFLNQPWAKWFNEAFARIGGSVALSLPELESRAADLEAQVNNIQSQINSLSGDDAELNQGPVL